MSVKKYIDEKGLQEIIKFIDEYFERKLISGQNIKTINYSSLLGPGNLSVGNGLSALTYNTKVIVSANPAINDIIDFNPAYLSRQAVPEDNISVIIENTTQGGTWIANAEVTTVGTPVYAKIKSLSLITGAPGADGADGTNGATFTPHVSSNGNLSWTNNGGLPNPETVNLMPVLPEIYKHELVLTDGTEYIYLTIINNYSSNYEDAEDLPYGKHPATGYVYVDSSYYPVIYVDRWDDDEDMAYVTLKYVRGNSVPTKNIGAGYTVYDTKTKLL